MKRLSIAILSLTALGLSADLAFAGLFNCCCCDRYTVCCKPYNAFSPPCCNPCGKNWPCCMAPFSPAPYPAPMANCAGCAPGYGGGAPADMGRPMPPATAAPGYMPPAPAEVIGQPQTMAPMMPAYGMPMQPGYGMPMQPVAFQPGYYPTQMPMMPGYGMPQGMMPGYGMPQGMMPGYAPPMMMAPGMQ